MKVYVVDGPNDKWWTKASRRIKAHAEEAWCTTKKFCKEHKSGIITGVVIATPVVTAVIKAAVAAHKQSLDYDARYCSVWDASLGHQWQLSRPLTTAEALELDARHQAGERLGDILQSMKVLK